MPKVHGKQIQDSTVTATQAETTDAVELTDSTNAEGSSSSLARADHTHSHGSRGGGTLHSAASGATAGFMSASDKLKLDALIDPNLLSPKDSVRAISTASNVTLNGAQTVDGVLLADGDRVAVFGQTTTTEDGLYDVVDPGAWTRTADFAAGSGQAGAIFAVEEGTSNADTLYQVTNDAGSDVVGTDDLSVVKYGSGTPRGAGAGLVLSGNDLDVVANADGSIVVNANDIQVGVIDDTQHGSRSGGTLHAVATTSVAGFLSSADKTKLDGIDTGAEVNLTSRQESVTTQLITNTDTALTDTLDYTPSEVASLVLYLNGVQQDQGAGLDYTISGTTITWLANSGTAVPMNTNDTMTATYLSA